MLGRTVRRRAQIAIRVQPYAALRPTTDAAAAAANRPLRHNGATP
jgi:hypothetical protein